MKKNKGKIKKRGSILKAKSQVTIFVVISLLVIFVVMIIYLNQDKIINVFSSTKSPINDVESCVALSLEEALQLVLMQGGSINPKNYYLYEGVKVDYTCYTSEFYKPCIMQKPVMINQVKTEIISYMEPKTEDCMKKIKKEYENEGYSISYENPGIEITITPRTVTAETRLNIRIRKDSEEHYNKINAMINSELYDFIMLAGSISNWEARYGDSETLSYMLYHPQIKLEKKTRSEGSRIYIMTNRETKEKFMFATRSYAFAPGVTGT